MAILIEEIAPKLRSDAIERELARELMTLPEAERLTFIKEMIVCGLPKTFPVGLWLAKTCLKKTASLEDILKQGLDLGDASTVEHWIETCISGLGHRRVIAIVKARLSTNPESVIKAEYWLRKYKAKMNQRDLAEFVSLQEHLARFVADNPAIEKSVLPFKITNHSTS